MPLRCGGADGLKFGKEVSKPKKAWIIRLNPKLSMLFKTHKILKKFNIQM